MTLGNAPGAMPPEQEVVQVRRHQTVGLLVIDNPPVNASSSAVRSRLLTGLAELSADSQISAIVLIGAGRNFISGSDLTEFGSETIPQPELPEVIEAIRTIDLPVIAALSGVTLGGGLELALSCDYRVAAPDTIVGLPETTLGMIPGAGGTQRTLHLVGPARTIEIVTSGRRYPVTADQVHGLVDAVIETDLEAAAVEYAREVNEKRDVLRVPIPAFDPGEVEAAAQESISRQSGQPQIIAAVGAVLAGLALSPEAALFHERNEFTRLRNADEAAALRHLFFARRACAKANRPIAPVPLRRVAVVGSGTMGRGIARAFADHGVDVILHDAQPEALDDARVHLEQTYDKEVSRGRLDPAEAQARINRVTTTPVLEGLAGADLYVEAVFEDVEVKRSVLRRLEPVSAGAVLATNTSYLDIELLADVLEAPERLLGLHFFSPAHRTPVVEVIHGRRTEQESLDTAFTAAKVLDKVAIRSAVGEGFIGNRVFNAYRQQCEFMLEEGALPQQVDAALRQFGFAMGPFAVADMSGLEIAWHMRQRTQSTRDPSHRYADIADRICERGWFGQKSGRGWYRYGSDGRTPQPDPDVTHIIEEVSASKSIERRTFTSEDISRRAVLAMSNEAALLMEDGIADRASDIDLMMVLGYGFPDFRGGPTRWACQQEPERLQEDLDALHRATGRGFRRGDLSLLNV